jgi:hypothetical protein
MTIITEQPTRGGLLGVQPSATWPGATSAAAAGISAMPGSASAGGNAAPATATGTIFRPTDLGGSEKYPIFVWGEGECSQNGLRQPERAGHPRNSSGKGLLVGAGCPYCGEAAWEVKSMNLP